MKHTPGPWEAKCFFENWLVVDSKNNILEIRGNGANARLIAAAPDLLEACSAALTFFEIKLPESQIAVIIREAIAKAEGGKA